MAHIDFTDATGPASLRNAFASPADRFANWVPMTRPVGDSVPRLSDGAITFFRNRTDYGVSLDVPSLEVCSVPKPGPLTLTAVPTAGTFPAGTYYYRVAVVLSRPGGDLISAACAERSVVLTGTTSSVLVSVPAVGGAAPGASPIYRVFRGTAPGGESGFYDTFFATSQDTNIALTPLAPPEQPTNLVAIADRLVEHLLQGGTCAVYCEDALGSVYPTCGLWPGSTPSLRLTNRQTLAYTLSLQLVNLAGSPARVLCVYV